MSAESRSIPDLMGALIDAVDRARQERREPTPDESYCDVRRHQECSGYTEDENDAETCLCNCHDEGLS